MIAVEHVCKRFSRVQALTDVSLTIERGARVALVGSNGSGKTTLLRAMLGLLRVEGRVLIDGVDVATSPERALVNVAYVPQIAPPLDAPAAELVRASASIRGIAVADVVARARVLGLDLEAIATTRLRDLSGGMKQKLLAAMALATKAPILVCDEPTANLDGAAREAFFAEVDARPEGSITILCSHREEEVQRLVDRVVELRDGRIVNDAAFETSRGAQPNAAAHAPTILPTLRVVA
jgi:ABC-2 type transport system ATP-binding protein